ncbi:hypothetical protein [Actinoplanes sp. NPDC051859]|uniref:hypothetical protein n=1 Tax=Actinoplanes sp. NPDC051859 TaxID=3363909 RepID=UPI00379BFEA2
MRTSNVGNSWASGSVTVAADHSGSAVFALPVVKPATAATTLAPPATGAFNAGSAQSGGSTCLKVTYTGSLPADLRLYATVSGDLAEHLLLSVDTGTSAAAGTDATCTGFTSTGYLLGSATNTDVTVADMPTGYTAGLAWNGVASGSSRWYRLSWLLPSGVPDSVQGERVEARFVWEAQNT